MKLAIKVLWIQNKNEKLQEKMWDLNWIMFSQKSNSGLQRILKGSS